MRSICIILSNWIDQMLENPTDDVQTPPKLNIEIIHDLYIAGQYVLADTNNDDFK